MLFAFVEIQRIGYFHRTLTYQFKMARYVAFRLPSQFVIRARQSFKKLHVNMTHSQNACYGNCRIVLLLRRLYSARCSQCCVHR